VVLTDVSGKEAIIAATIATLVGAAAAVAPLPTLAVVAAAAAFVMAFFAPRAAVAIAVLAILFVRPIERLTSIDGLSYLDEAAVAMCVVMLPLRRVMARRPLRTFPGQWWFTGFFVVGILSGVVLHVPPVIYLSGAFVLGKGLLLAWAVAQIDWAPRHLVKSARIGTFLMVVSLVACAANLAAPSAWNAVMASDANAVQPRSFLPSLIGPFTHPIDLGQFMALSAVAVAAWRAAVRKGPLTMALLIGTVAGAGLTARRTAAASLTAAWLTVQAMVRSTRVLLVLVVCLPVALVLLVGPVTHVVQVTYHDYIGKGTPEARTVLTLDSFAVAADHFPAGAGFGRFGSAVAATNYSPEYLARGYTHIWGLGRTAQDGRFLTDTEWPAIIGETGFLGAAMFAMGLFAIFRAGRRLVRGDGDPLRRWAGLTSVGWLVALLVESVGTVSFTGPPVSGAFFALVGVVTALSDPDPTPPDQVGPRQVGREQVGREQVGREQVGREMAGSHESALRADRRPAR
jgi:hypothetical protein